MNKPGESAMLPDYLKELDMDLTPADERDVNPWPVIDAAKELEPLPALTLLAVYLQSVVNLQNKS